MSTATEPFPVADPTRSFDGYTPELARRLEERADELDDMIAIAFHLSARLSPHVQDTAQLLCVVVEDIGWRYRSHRERTPQNPMGVAQFVDEYVNQVEATAEGDTRSRAEVWADHIARLDTTIVPFDDNPHADMTLLVDEQVIGGSRYDPDEQWMSWGPAGKSSGHSSRSAAELVQLDTYRARH
jgi:hypothetical protein